MSLRIGVVGHRNHLLPEDEREALAARVSNTLSDIVAAIPTNSGARPPVAVVVSALAEGADRMGARAALELGLPLHCPLPFRREEYEHDFETAASKEEFRALLAQATYIEELPGRRDGGSEAYVEVGRRIVDGSDILIALWNGEPARGPGGTGDIVAGARQSKPVVWIPVEPRKPTRILGCENEPDSTQHPSGSLPDVVRTAMEKAS